VPDIKPKYTPSALAASFATLGLLSMFECEPLPQIVAQRGVMRQAAHCAFRGRIGFVLRMHHAAFRQR
jgi:hypothetical protein